MKLVSANLLRTAVAMLGGAVIAAVISAAVPSTTSQAAAAQAAPAAQSSRPAAPPVPCGPQGQLPGNLSKNVDGKSRCFEVRIYTVDSARVGTGNFKGDIHELHQRFREKEVAIFRRLGAEILGVWQQMDNPNTLVWMLAYRDRAHRDDVWAKFSADPEWTALRAKYPVPVNANTFMMSAADYSPMK